MKGLLLVLLSAVLVLQLTSAYPQYRVRREAQKSLSLTDGADKKRTELQDYLVQELIILAQGSVNSNKKLFENILKNADKDDLKSDALKTHLAKFSDLLSKANSIGDLESEESIEKLFDVFGECTDLVDQYDDLEDPTEEQKLIKRLLDENGSEQIMLDFLVDFLKLRTNYKTHIQEYVDSLSSRDKEIDEKFLEWFETFKKTNDFEKSVDLTMQVFDFFE